MAVVFYFLTIGLSAVSQILLLFFAGVIGAVIFSGLAEILVRRGVSYRVSLGIVLVVVLASFGLLAMVAGSAIVEQGEQLSEGLPAFLHQARIMASSLPFGEKLLTELSDPSLFKATSYRLLGWSSTLLGALSSGLLLGVIILYLTADPKLYWNGITRLFPPAHRSRVKEVGELVRERVWEFVKGQSVSMSVLAVLTSVGLWALDVPLYLLLGVMTGLFVMIPYLGPILSLAPAALVAAGQGTDKVLWVLVLFAVLQFLESYILTPLVQKEVAALPPVLTLFAQTVMGLIFGLLGVILAAPLTAASLVLVEELWVKPLEESGLN